MGDDATARATTSQQGQGQHDVDSLTAWVAGRVEGTTETLESGVAALRECVLAWEEYRLQLATFLGVTTNDSTALSYLVARGPMAVSELGTLLGFGSGSTTLLVDRLEAKGLVRRRRDPDDRRRAIVEASWETHQQLASMAGWPAVVFAGLDERGIVEHTRVLSAVGERLREFAQLVSTAQSPFAPPRRRQ